MRWVLCIVFLSCFSALFGQNPEVARLQSKFETARSQQNKAEAQKAFHSLFKIDKVAAAALEPDLHGILYPASGPGPSALDTMLMVYQIGLAHFPDKQAKWLGSRAVFGYRWREQLDGAGKWLLEAIAHDPLAADVSLLDMWAETAEDAFQTGKIKFPVLLRQWGLVDKALYMREVVAENAVVPFDYRRKLRGKVLDLGGGCKSLLNSKGLEDAEMLYASALCPNSFAAPFRNFAAESTADPAWMLRLQADLALNQGDSDAFFELLGKALKVEDHPLLKADLHCQRAFILQEKRRFREARAELKAAIASEGGWGRPYLQLAALYADGAQTCDMSEFEQKAVYWLAMDVVLEGRNKCKGFEDSFNEAYADYTSRMPDAKDASFRGLRGGDTWPIKCWMNTVTTAKGF